MASWIGTDGSNQGDVKTQGSSSDSSASALDITNSSGAALLLVRNDKRVGIGTTAPDTKLHVHNATADSDVVLKLSVVGGTGADALVNFRDDNESRDWALGARDSGNLFVLSTGSDLVSNEKVAVDADGNVGIGTTAPSDRLTVVMPSGVNQEGLTLQAVAASGSGSQPGVRFNNSSGTELANVFASSDNRLYLKNNATYALVIDSGGNVGIGTTSPSYKLHVANSTQLRGIYAETNYSTANPTAGVEGRSSGSSITNYGVYGQAAGSSGSSYGVYGAGAGSGTNYGVYGASSGGTTNWAGYFNGDVYAGAKLEMGGNIALKDKYLSNDGDDEGIRVDDGGRVGIGTTPDSSTKLTVRSTTARDPVIEGRVNSSEAAAVQGTVEWGAEDNYCFAGVNYTDSTTEECVFQVCRYGNVYTKKSVGINDNSFLQETGPTYKLSIGGKVYIDDGTSPTAPPGAVVLFFDGTDLIARRSGVSDVNLTNW